MSNKSAWRFNGGWIDLCGVIMNDVRIRRRQSSRIDDMCLERNIHDCRDFHRERESGRERPLVVGLNGTIGLSRGCQRTTSSWLGWRTSSGTLRTTLKLWKNGVDDEDRNPDKSRGKNGRWRCKHWWRLYDVVGPIVTSRAFILGLLLPECRSGMGFSAWHCGRGCPWLMPSTNGRSLVIKENSQQKNNRKG